MEGEGKLTQRKDECKKKSKCGRSRDGNHLAGGVCVAVGGGTGAHEWTKRLKRGEVRTCASSCRSPVSL